MIKPYSKTVYLRGKEEPEKLAAARVAKIEKLQKKLGKGTTESAAVRLMIDNYTL